MVKIKSYPLPTRNNIPDKEIFAYGQELLNIEDQQQNYLRKISREVIGIKNQYLSIEQQMLNSFEFVNPILSNIKTTSVRFATIIREASNLFEIISRDLYTKLFVKSTGIIDIQNFLSPDTFINLREGILSSPALQDEFNNSNILQPFKLLETWDKNSEIKPNNIPKW
ncbi:hypothetical protein [Paenibacillus sp. MMS18-CY102]|uniref:hypothetical protein n=1 Tax=Paenibacillus sp. MMS18-CY102 TaxID=2682849 RepID=UPI0013665AAF|nr:hypothetical protein [Paenibacillus sp. MMS18-CY102]MWC27168.1 hypothetical protein [Paenibacillus sp. MMS18-CY102]